MKIEKLKDFNTFKINTREKKIFIHNGHVPSITEKGKKSTKLSYYKFIFHGDRGGILNFSIFLFMCKIRKARNQILLSDRRI